MTRRSASEELLHAASLINRVLEGIAGDMRIGVHVCRGNWSKRDNVHLSGDYTPLIKAFEQMQVRQFVLEFATSRAGEIDVVGRTLASHELGLGVVNQRSEQVESVEAIVEKVERALQYFRPAQIFMNPDCGFGTFAQRCMSDERTALEKMRRIVQAARVLRERYG